MDIFALGRQRRAARINGYASIGDFHGGLFECNYVSPLTKSGHNLNADVMVIAQDWASAEYLLQTPPDKTCAEQGYDPKLPTNRNLDDLLCRHFNIRRSDCYLTNIFPFVKMGGMSAAIPMKHIIRCTREFTLPEIGIVKPRIIICLGKATFVGLMKALGIKPTPSSMQEAIASPFQLEGSKVFCVPHPGARGIGNRGRDQMERDWQRIAMELRRLQDKESRNASSAGC